MFKKRKMTDLQKVTIENANCYNCGWRYPCDSNEPLMCVLGCMDNFDMKACHGRSRCDRYVQDKLLEVHIGKIINKLLDQKLDDIRRELV